MLAFLKGKVHNKTENKLFLEVNGIGYELLINPAIASKLPPVHGEAFIYTYLQVKEDGLSLFGFHNMETKSFFEQLITVSGIGPKLALGIIGAANTADIARAIVQGNIDILSKLPGIGKKTAQRLVLELKDKLSIEDDDIELGKDILVQQNGKNDHNEAVEALLALGYQGQEAKQLVKEAVCELGANNNLEDLIRTALKKASMSRR